VASIKGSKLPEESVILSGHLDAYDVATGGVDCSSGCSAVMEAARMIALSGAKPKRTMYFILFAAEEFGLLGAEAWVKAHPEKLDGISNMFNRDGGPLAYTSFSVPASLVDEFEKISEPLREAYPDYGFTINAMTPRARPTSTGGTDASVFSIRGVPTVGMRETDAKGYDFQYREIWHTERDTFTESIPEYQEQSAAAMSIIGLGTANLDEKFPRNEVYTD
jgi:Zn-dependent M28 family amino/carboxypeptidase